MSPRGIRAYLRGAVRAGYLWGQKQIGPDAFLLNPYPGPTRTLTTSEATDYCQMLKQSGVEPLYVETELLGYQP